MPPQAIPAGSAEPAVHRWVLARNCALAPQALATAFAAAALLPLAIASAFAAAGAWLVLPFAGLEALAFALAFVAHARSTEDRERIELSAGRLTVTRSAGGRCERWVLEAAGARVHVGQDRVTVRACGTEVEVGRYLGEERRRALARELAEKLHGEEKG